MAIVGAFIRIGGDSLPHVRENVAAIEGVSLFDLDDPRKVGLLVEACDLDAAHAVLASSVRGVEGVLGVWPVFAHFGAEDDDIAAPADAVADVEGVAR